MSWYAAKLLFETELDNESLPDALCEESIRLIDATSAEDAEAKAADVGRAAEHSYANEDGQIVHWRFRAVQEVQDLCEEQIVHGVEVFSRMFRREQG